MNKRIHPADVLRAVGMHPKYRGYAYMLYILEITLQYPEYVYRLSGTLYPKVMERYGTTMYSVERNIRFAIHRMWETGNREEIGLLFKGYDSGWVPTNAEFIAITTAYLRREIEVQMIEDTALPM